MFHVTVYKEKIGKVHLDINKISRAKDDIKDSSIVESESKLPTAGREVRERSNEPYECVAK